ncbi:hypothetical protein MKW35_17295, partial [Aestuariibaculum sp. L182]|nr:hypothetical protein [Aestuariibaculum lutulentum]
ARSLQARLFRHDGVVDAVPEAGKVRIVRQPSFNGKLSVDGRPVALTATPPRFEDGFMVLFSAVAGEGHSSSLELQRAADAARKD